MRNGRSAVKREGGGRGGLGAGPVRFPFHRKEMRGTRTSGNHSHQKRFVVGGINTLDAWIDREAD